MQIAKHGISNGIERFFWLNQRGKKKKKDNYACNFPLPKTSTYSPWEEDNNMFHCLTACGWSIPFTTEGDYSKISRRVIGTEGGMRARDKSFHSCGMRFLPNYVFSHEKFSHCLISLKHSLMGDCFPWRVSWTCFFFNKHIFSVVRIASLKLCREERSFLSDLS